MSMPLPTLWYGIRPRRGTALAWGWLIRGGVFLLVGLGSIEVYFATQNFIECKRSEMSSGKLAAYWTVTTAVVLMGVPLGIATLTAA